ncbi:MAG TPA: hypothetical protein VM912_11840 [Terriglobales bacterium]|nr:hypothetical protein [Terriglobales bacterium]
MASESALSLGATISLVKPITAVRIFWSACVALFLSAVVGLRWGAQISIALLPSPERNYVDHDLLRSVWITRSIFLFLLCALCGVLGIYFSVRASDQRQS